MTRGRYGWFIPGKFKRTDSAPMIEHDRWDEYEVRFKDGLKIDIVKQEDNLIRFIVKHKK